MNVSPNPTAPATQELTFKRGERAFNYHSQCWGTIDYDVNPNTQWISFTPEGGTKVPTPRGHFNPACATRKQIRNYRAEAPQVQSIPLRERTDGVTDAGGPERYPDAKVRNPLEHPSSFGSIDGSHIKHFIVSYMRKDATVGVEKVAGKSILLAIEQFYLISRETAVISIVCIL